MKPRVTTNLKLLNCIVAVAGIVSMCAEAATLTVGKDKTVVSMDFHETSFGSDPGNPLPLPEQREATSSGNTAYVKLVAEPGSAGIASADIGLDLNWDTGTNSWEDVQNLPVIVTIDLSYEVAANWVQGYGSSDAQIWGTSLPLVHLGYGSGTTVLHTNNHVRVAYNTSLSELTGPIRFHVYCHAHLAEYPAPPPGTVHTALARVTINSIAFEFPEPNFAVVDVISRYCSKQQHVYFLNGVSLDVAFKAVVNWNGRTPSHILYKKRGAYTLVPDNEPCFFDVGAFAAGDALTATAIAADGTQSDPIRVNCDVISPPFGIPVSSLHVVPAANILKYTTDKFSLKVLDPHGDTVSADVPIFGGMDLGFTTVAEAEASVCGDGSAIANLAAGGGSKIKLAGFNVFPRFTGRPEWNYNGTDWRAGGYIGLASKAGLKSPPAYVWATPPIFFRADVDIDTAVLFGIAGWDAQNDPLLNGEWDFSAQVIGVVGCGASGILAVEGYLGGGPIWTVQYPQQPTLERLGVELNGGIRVVALVWEWNAGLLHYEWWLVGGAQGQGMRLLTTSLAQQVNRPNASQFRLVPRNYLKTSYAVTGSATTRQPLALDEGGVGILSATLDVLQANVYPYSEPALAVCGSNRLMVWIWDDPARSDENRTTHVWCKWTGLGWTNPTSVWDEGTADFSPSLAIFPDGKALTAWQNERASLTNGATLTEALSGLEVAVSIYAPATDTWTSTNLTDNGFIDRNPQLAGATNGTALLTWISNPSNDMNGTATNLNTVASRRWTGSEWVDAVNITTNARMLLWSTVAWSGSNGVFLAAIDGDDDQSTLEDQELFGATFDGSAWSPFAGLTTNGVQDTRPQAAFDNVGNLLVAWFQGSNIMMRVGDLDLGSPSLVGEIGGTSSAKDFRLVTGPAGQISMVWADVAEDGTGPDPFMFNYDPALHVWSKALCMMNNTNLLERSFSPAYTTNGTLLMAYNQVHIQTDTNSLPVFTNNVVDLMLMDYLIGGDLGLGSSDITLSTNYLAAGQTVDVLAVVHNFGELAATNIPVAFFDGNPTSGGLLIGSTQTVAQLVAGDSTNVQISWPIPLTVSNQTVYVVVDPALAQEDRNRANNTASMIALSPDLALSEMAVLNTATNQRIVIARVVNEGAFSSGRGFDVTFRQGSTNGPVLATSAIDSLPAGGQYDVNFEWYLSGITFTDAFETVYAVADPDGVVAESERGNNLSMVQVMTFLDTDGDGLLDGEEMRYGSSVSVQDSDGDGLKDGEEVHVYATSPVLADSDADGAKDGDEVRAGTDPNSAADVFAIRDLDVMTGLSLVHWSAKSNKTYQIMKSSELLTWTNAPSGAGTNQQSQQTATTNGVLLYVDPQSVTNGNAFYRVDLKEE